MPKARDDWTRIYLKFRRVGDVLCSITAIILTLPIMAIVYALVLVDVGPPVIFCQVRPGRYLRPFTLYKFRTMLDAYDEAGLLLCDSERTSALGKGLRRTRLDELPQLFNVLVGDMTLVGPRPLLPRDQPEERLALERSILRPGITGWAQVNGGHQLNAAEKVALDWLYAYRIGPVFDIRIFILTIKTIIFGERINQNELQKAVLLYHSNYQVERQYEHGAPEQL